MNAPHRLSDLVPGLVIGGGKRTITDPEVGEFAARYGSAHEDETRALPVSRRKQGGRLANHWLVCAVAEQLAESVVGAACRPSGVLYIERLSWPNAAHAGDDLELKIEVLDKRVIASGAAGLVRWHWILATSGGQRVLDLVLDTLLEDKARRENMGVASAPIAYKVSAAAAMLGVSRYVLYEAIREQQLHAYRPSARSDFMILAEDLRDWVARYPARPKGRG